MAKRNAFVHDAFETKRSHRPQTAAQKPVSAAHLNFRLCCFFSDKFVEVRDAAEISRLAAQANTQRGQHGRLARARRPNHNV